MPLIKDTANGDRRLECTDIAYFEGTQNRAFMTVAGFNINNKEKKIQKASLEQVMMYMQIKIIYI